MTEPYAIASLSLSILGIVTVVGPVVGIVFGFIARSRIRRSEGRSKGKGLALAGIILGFVDTAVVILLIVALASPSGPGGDQALAAREIVPASSYPSGFSGLGSDTGFVGASYFSDFSASDVPDLESCLGIGAIPEDVEPVEHADQAYMGGTAVINDTVDVFPTARLAADDLQASGRPNALTCLFKYWGPTLGSDLSPDMGPGEHDGPPTPVSGTSGTAWTDDQWSIAYTYQGGSGTEVNDWVAVRSGRSVSYLEFSDLDAPVPAKLRATMIAKAKLAMDDR